MHFEKKLNSRLILGTIFRCFGLVQDVLAGIMHRHSGGKILVRLGEKVRIDGNLVILICTTISRRIISHYYNTYNYISVYDPTYRMGRSEPSSHNQTRKYSVSKAIPNSR